MPRKAIPRALPVLANLFPGFAGFTESASKKEALIKKLRVIAKSLRSARPQPFYPMREVAKHFSLPLATVGLAYEALEREGILTRIRGSQTLVSGNTVSPCKPVRAVIGFPFRMHALVVSPYARALHIELEDRLQDNGFLVDLIFYLEDQNGRPEFAEHLIRRNLNIVIWHTPDPNTFQVIRMVADHGIQQVIIQPTECMGVVDYPVYLLDWQPAYHAAGEDWHRRGIRHVIIPCPVRLDTKRVLSMFTEVMKEKGMSVEVMASDAQTIYSRAKHLSIAAPVMVAFLDQVGSEILCSERPVVLEEMLRFSRIAFCRGPIRAPYFECRSLSADMVGFPACSIADKIATDLRMLPAIPRKILATFQATHTPDNAFRDRKDRL